MLSISRPTKRVFEDDDDSENVVGPTGYLQRTQKPRLRRTSMAQLIGVDLTKLELLSFFYHHSIVDILSANHERDKEWIKGTPSRVSSSRTIKKACLLLAAMDLAQRRAPAKYLINDEPHMSHIPIEKVTKKQMTGYVAPTEEFQARQMVQFTALLKNFEQELSQIQEGGANYGDMIIAGTMVYITALAMGPLVPIINFFPGQGDLVGISRTISSVHEIMTGVAFTSDNESPYPILDDVSRHYLPREKDLWDTIEMCESKEEKAIMHKALHSLIESYNMDIDGGCITHMTSWFIYWPHSFRELQQQRNPYALIMLCYWCAYVHSFHGYAWWRDRAVEDLYTVLDELPAQYHYLVQWPLCVVQNFDIDEEDYLSGRIRTLNF